MIAPGAHIISAIVALCFFFSGLAGLVYQIVWTRYLALFLGHTSYSILAVLTAFMGGLALGNAWLGARADRSRAPLALYGVLEIGIAIYAVLFPVIYEFAHGIFVRLAQNVPAGETSALALKFLMSLLTIVVPAILMGATFPVMTRFVTLSLAELRSRVAGLYSLNSAGAVAGCFVAAFWWIPQVGLEQTVLFGALINFVVGILALGTSRWINEPQFAANAALPESPKETRQPVEVFTRAELRIAVIGIGISGFVAMLYEVAWTRVLALALGSSTHAFSLMLITFISGIAVGSWIIYRWRSLRRTFEAFAWAEAALAAAIFVSMFFVQWLPYWFAKAAHLLARHEAAYPLYTFLQLGLCFIVMFVPTILLGMTLPLASRIATSELAHTGRSVGMVFAVNTIGTVLGVVITGLWIMPALGLAKTFALGAALNLAVAGAVLAVRSPMRTVPIGLVTVALAAGMIWFSGWKFDRVWQHVLPLGLWRFAQPPSDREEYLNKALAENIKYYRDGAGATVTVYTWEENGVEQLSLKVNGKTDANSKADVPTQTLSGHIPMLLHPDPRQVLVVGLGSGMTVGAVAAHPSVGNLDVVEISPEVITAARMFADHNNHVLEDPRVRVAVEDAKSFLKVTDRRYDVIISEPSNPWMAGIAGVFSYEFYLDCKSRLNPSGLMVQWIHLYETSDAAVELVLATFNSVFPHVNIWHGAPKDLILVGSLSPMSPDLSRIAQQFEHPAVKRDLARTGVHRLPVLLACELVPAENAPFLYSPESPVHSDYFPILEYIAQKAFFARNRAEAWRAADETQSPRARTLLSAYLQRHALTEEDFLSFAEAYAVHRLFRPELFRSIVQQWKQALPDSDIPLEIFALLNDPTERAEVKASRLQPHEQEIYEIAATDPALLREYEGILMAEYRAQRSTFYLPPVDRIQRAVAFLKTADPSNRVLYDLHSAELAWDRGDDRTFLEIAEKEFADNAAGAALSERLDPRAPKVVLARLIETHWRAGRTQEARRFCAVAQSLGYVDLRNNSGDAQLILLCRKVENQGT